MTLEEMQAIFEDNDDEFLKFQNIPDERRVSLRPDLNAFILIDRLVPTKPPAHMHARSGGFDIVSSSEHDVICLGVSPSDFAAVASMEDVLDLMRCGIMYDDEYECFQSFT